MNCGVQDTGGTRRRRLIFVTWDGPGTAYHENLFIPILERFRRDEEIEILQFTWGDRDRTERVRARADAAGFKYAAVEFGPPQAHQVIFTLLRGAARLRAIAPSTMDTVIARSAVPAAMALVARSRGAEFDFVYDADGLAADEGVEFGGWSAFGPRYAAFRTVERAAVRRARRVLTRTQEGARVLARRTGVPLRRFAVIANASDETVFHPGTPDERQQVRETLGQRADAPLVVYAGSVGPQYELASMVEFIAELTRRRRDTKALFLVPAGVRETVAAALAASGCEATVQTVVPAEVARWLRAGDVGLALRSASLSQQAISPVKTSEYLLTGLPVVYRPDVSGLARALDRTTGFAWPRGASPAAAAAWVTEQVIPERDRFREAARQRGIELASLDRGAADLRQGLSC